MGNKLLFVVTEDWYFVSHRLPLAIAAANNGFDVAVATRIGRDAEVIRKSGIRLIPLELSRRSGNPFLELWALFCLYRRERPQLVHHVALKPVVFGALAAWLVRGISQVNAISGLGWLFISSHSLVRLIRPVLRWSLARLLNSPHSLTIVQNSDDLALLKQAGVDSAHLRLISGAGVDVNIFHPVPCPPHPICVMLVARMLWDKGVGEFVEAARILTEKGVNARFILVGDPDPANPTSIPEPTLRAWHGKYGVEWWGRQNKIAAVWQSAHIACLPSYREGMPKSLLEAAACGLPIVTTDAPGCREVIDNGIEGLIIPLKNSLALAKALETLILQPDLRNSMGDKARQRALKIFNQEKVIEATLKIYGEAI